MHPNPTDQCKRLKNKATRFLKKAKELEAKAASKPDKSVEAHTLHKKPKKKNKGESGFQPSTFSQLVSALAPPPDWEEQGYLTGEGEGGSYYVEDDEGIGVGVLIAGGVAILGVTGLLGYVLLKKPKGKKPKSKKVKAVAEKAEPMTVTGPALVPLEEDML